MMLIPKKLSDLTVDGLQKLLYSRRTSIWIELRKRSIRRCNDRFRERTKISIFKAIQGVHQEHDGVI